MIMTEVLPEEPNSPQWMANLLLSNDKTQVVHHLVFTSNPAIGWCLSLPSQPIIMMRPHSYIHS